MKTSSVFVTRCDDRNDDLVYARAYPMNKDLALVNEIKTHDPFINHEHNKYVMHMTLRAVHDFIS